MEYSVGTDQVERFNNLPLQLLVLREKFQHKYGNQFEDAFVRCILSLKQLVRDIEIEVCSKETSNNLGSLRIQWGKDAISYNVNKHTFENIKVKTKDVFNDEIQINIQKKVSLDLSLIHI